MTALLFFPNEDAHREPQGDGLTINKSLYIHI